MKSFDVRNVVLYSTNKDCDLESKRYQLVGQMSAFTNLESLFIIKFSFTGAPNANCPKNTLRYFDFSLVLLNIVDINQLSSVIANASGEEINFPLNRVF